MTSSWYRTLFSRTKLFRFVYHVLRTSPADAIRTSPYGLICNSKEHVLSTFWGHLKDVLIWFCNAMKCPRDKDFYIIVILLRLTTLKLNNQTYKFIWFLNFVIRNDNKAMQIYHALFPLFRCLFWITESGECFMKRNILAMPQNCSKFTM